LRRIPNVRTLTTGQSAMAPAGLSPLCGVLSSVSCDTLRAWFSCVDGSFEVPMLQSLPSWERWPERSEGQRGGAVPTRLPDASVSPPCGVAFPDRCDNGSSFSGLSLDGRDAHRRCAERVNNRLQIATNRVAVAASSPLSASSLRSSRLPREGGDPERNPRNVARRTRQITPCGRDGAGVARVREGEQPFRRNSQEGRSAEATGPCAGKDRRVRRLFLASVNCMSTGNGNS